MIGVARVKLRVIRNLPGLGQVLELEEPGMYVADGCVVVPGKPGAVLPLHLVDSMVPAEEAPPQHDLAPVHPAPARRGARKAQ